MAEITTITPATQVGSFLVTPTDLTGADTLTYKTSKKQTLYLNNTTVGSVPVVIDGDGGTTIRCPGLGADTDVSGGYTITLAAGEVHAVELVNIKAYLTGVVNVTGGVTGVLAWIQEG